MPVNLQDIVQNTAEVEVGIAGVTLHVAYYPMNITPEEQEKLMAEDSKPTLEILSQYLAKVGKTWDLLWNGPEGTGKAEPMPFEYEVLRKYVPFRVQNDVLRAVMDDMYPNRSSGGSLGGT